MAVPTFGSVMIGSSQVDAMKNWYRACFPDVKENEMGAFEFLMANPEYASVFFDGMRSMSE